MKEKFKLKGFWFTPNNIQRKIPGVLYFDREKEIRLELIGNFSDNIIELFNDDNKIITLFGLTNENKKITLLNCFKANGSWNFSSDFGLAEYKAKYLIIGKHFVQEDKTFNSVEFSFSNLYNWYNKSIINHSINFTKQSKAEKFNFSLSDFNKVNAVYKIEEDLALKLISKGGYKTSNKTNGYELTQDVSINIESLSSKNNIFFFWGKIKLLEDFFILANLGNIHLNNINLVDNDEYYTLKKGSKVQNSIEVFFINEITNEKKYDLLFNFNDISTSFSEILNQWISLDERLVPIRQHLISSLKVKKKFTSLDFLIVIQSLEGYHRRFVDNNKNTLQKRIEGLIKKFSYISKVDLTNSDIQNAVSSRHYYSHFYEESENVLYGIELFNLTEKLKTLLICCVLKLNGFENDLTKKLIEQNQNL